MVRKLCHCGICKGRFISASGMSQYCKQCRSKRSIPIPSFAQTTAMTTTDMTTSAMTTSTTILYTPASNNANSNSATTITPTAPMANDNDNHHDDDDDDDNHHDNDNERAKKKLKQNKLERQSSHLQLECPIHQENVVETLKLMPSEQSRMMAIMPPPGTSFKDPPITITNTTRNITPVASINHDSTTTATTTTATTITMPREQQDEDDNNSVVRQIQITASPEKSSFRTNNSTPIAYSSTVYIDVGIHDENDDDDDDDVIVNEDHEENSDAESDSCSENMTLAQVANATANNATIVPCSQVTVQPQLQLQAIEGEDEMANEKEKIQQPSLMTPTNERKMVQQPSSAIPVMEENEQCHGISPYDQDRIKDDQEEVESMQQEQLHHASSSSHHFSSATMCFICGCSFHRITTGYKGRLNHIKRCSKKHGVTAGDMKVNDDEQDFCPLPPSPIQQRAAAVATTNATSNTTHNPYSKRAQWHGDAEEDLKLAAPAVTVATTSSENVTTTIQNQTTMTSFFTTTAVKSLNNVLMAGAKRVARTGHHLFSTKKTSTALQDNQKPQGGGHGRGRRSWNSNNNNNRNHYSNCPYYKKIPGTDFVCDGFMYAHELLTKNYFLTHFHSDHYGGITKSWNAGIIYCSLVTANLVAQQLGVNRKYLHPLGMNSPVVIMSNATTTTNTAKPVTVTLLDANHCPGAVMFLFQVGKRSILHVGDFRWHRQRMMMQPELKPFMHYSYSTTPSQDNASTSSQQQSLLQPLQQLSPKIRLDDLFLDTTYCNEKYTLPTQEQAIAAAIQKAKEEMESCFGGHSIGGGVSKSPHHHKTRQKRVLLLFGAYTIGKERIYMSVAEELGMKICVDKYRYRILSIALSWSTEQMDQVFTTDRNMTCLWVVPLGHVNFKKMAMHYDTNGSSSSSSSGYSDGPTKVFSKRTFDKIVGFRPTGWSLTGCKNNKNGSLLSTQRSGIFTIHGVPYSEHSSFPELVDCLDCLKPKRIIPTVSVAKSDAQVAMLLKEVKKKHDNVL